MLDLAHDRNSITAQRFTQVLIFIFGIYAMTVSSWYLIEGLLNFAGSGSSRYAFIAVGITFQITESICFIGAASLGKTHLQWKYLLFIVGIFLFVFSIGLMTIAQRATLASGEMQIEAQNKQIALIESQIASLDRSIESYRFNAEKQSRSIYKDSRALGQDSLNRTIELEQKKSDLSKELFAITTNKQTSSMDFFKRVEKITGFPAMETEFFLLSVRSFGIEMCGILLMSFAAFLRRITPQHKPLDNPYKMLSEDQLGNLYTIFESKNEPIFDEPHSAENKLVVDNNVDVFQEQQKAHNKRKLQRPRVDYDFCLDAIQKLYEEGELELTQVKVKDALMDHHNINIGNSTAAKLIRMSQKRLDS